MAKTVFLVDDMDFSRNILRRILEKIGYTVVGEASDGIEALQSLEEMEVDIVITDVIMPFMNGVEFLRKFRETDKKTKVIVMSSTGYDDRIKKIYEYGGDGFLTKPYTEKQVKEILENL